MQYYQHDSGWLLENLNALLLSMWQNLDAFFHRSDPEPTPVATPDALQLNESPIADTGRYDQLSEKLDPARLVEESKDA